MSSLIEPMSNLKIKESDDEFIQTRLDMLRQILDKNELAINSLENKEISVKTNDVEVKGISNKITPKDILEQIIPNRNDRKQFIVAKVDNNLWDLTRPLIDDCILDFVTFDSEEGKHVFWHSSAHVLGQALEIYFGAKLCSGPPIEQGFYYDVFLDGRVVLPEDLKNIEKICKRIIDQKQKFERVTVSKPDLMQIFKDNEFKLKIIEEKVKDDFTTVYRCGDLVDLCRGPHLEHTGVANALSVIKSSGSYFGGKSCNQALQRVYGISFPTKEELKKWKIDQEEAEKRDHRRLGKEHELFFFHELSPGSCFFLPKGAHIYNKLINFIKSEYLKRGFVEVISPNIYNVKLWKTSGHYENYAENMFMFNIENEEFGLKPMNCPGHCLMYGMRTRSYKELPLRLADFGVLHRNELSGALSGLTRVRRFCQDDAHIFCRLDQVGSEIESCLNFLFYVHQIFNFDLRIVLSTRPSKSIGDDNAWEKAESALKSALEASNHKWSINEGDGAFYGPKIDIQVKDALSRMHQLSTIQLDFNLPQRFQLKYVNEDDSVSQPVMIHRAILGSLERFIGILTESFAGKWPFWISPHQVSVLSLHTDVDSYARNISNLLTIQGITNTLDIDPTVSTNKKIRNASLSNCNFIFVLGKMEMDSETISVRMRGGKQMNNLKFSSIIEAFKKLDESRTNEDIIEF